MKIKIFRETRGRERTELNKKKKLVSIQRREEGVGFVDSGWLDGFANWVIIVIIMMMMMLMNECK